MSCLSASAMTAFSISSALLICTNLLTFGFGIAVGPVTKVTSAPIACAVFAMAYPILPELRLVMARTGSIASSVGPAVMRTRFFWSNLGCWLAHSMSINASGSDMRPSPVSPHACSPVSGPRIAIPSCCNCRILRCVEGFSHICLFMAGATNNGQSLARQSVESRSSALPWTSFAIKSALAGAIIIASASRDSSI